MSCGVGLRLALLWLWLWHRSATIAAITPLTWEPPYASALKGQKTKKKKKKKRTLIFWVNTPKDLTNYLIPFFHFSILTVIFSFFFLVAPVAYGSSWARDRILATTLMFITAVTTLDPLTHRTRPQGSNQHCHRDHDGSLTAEQELPWLWFFKAQAYFTMFLSFLKSAICPYLWTWPFRWRLATFFRLVFRK